VTSHGEAEFCEANSSGRNHGLASGYNRFRDIISEGLQVRAKPEEIGGGDVVPGRFPVVSQFEIRHLDSQEVAPASALLLCLAVSKR